LLLLLPAFLATRGGVYGSLGARLSTGLHQGLIEPKFRLDWRLRNAIVASFLNGMTVSVFIAVVTYVWLTLLGSEGNLFQLVGIMVVAGFLSAVLMISVLIAVIFIGYRRGLDPDNVIGPVVTTLGDVFGVFFLLVGIYTVGAVL
jgi:mgtE-like transporter